MVPKAELLILARQDVPKWRAVVTFGYLPRSIRHVDGSTAYRPRRRMKPAWVGPLAEFSCTCGVSGTLRCRVNLKSGVTNATATARSGRKKEI